MKKIIVLLLSLSFISSKSQITTAPATATSLVQNYLLGAGVTASNITFTGYANSAASFTATAGTNLGFNGGVYLTSGSYLTNDPLGFGGPDGPEGPSSNFQSIDNNMPGDADLDNISGFTTYNAAILEFDFVPQSDTVKFNYTFGSEEYNDYVNGSVNDAFAFILSGVSTPLAPVNIALIPGTSIPVSINTVNNGNSFGVSTGPCTNCAYFRDNINGGIDCTYDGLTTVLTARHPVICGETYHIKIAIADAGDGVFDSGVFLEQGSFSSSSPFSVSSSVNGTAGSTVAMEGCDAMDIYFVRPESSIGTAASYTIDIAGTALAGIDYSPIPNAVNFAVGQDSVLYNFTPLLDPAIEGPESILITVNNVSICGVVTSITYTLTIVDGVAISLNTTNDTICPGTNGLLTASSTGGYGVYHYTWSNGLGSNDSVTISPAATTIYTVTVDDDCINIPPVQQTATLTVIPAFNLSIPAQQTVFCTSTTSALVTAVTTPYVPGSWTGTGLTDAGSGVAGFNPSALTPGTYNYVYNAGASGCVDKDSIQITINQYTASTFPDISNFCSNSPAVIITPTFASGQFYLDNNLFTGTIDPSALTTGIHTVKYVTGIPACPDSTTKMFTVFPKPIVSFSVDTTQGCLIGGNVYSFKSDLLGSSTPNGNYYWSFGDGSGNLNFDDPIHVYSSAGVYTIGLEYYDPNGCYDDTTIVSLITVHPQPRADFYFSNENPSILDPEVTMFNTSSSNSTSFSWDISGIGTSNYYNVSYSFEEAGSYFVTLLATTSFGCVDSITRSIKIANDHVIYVPNSFTPNNDGKNDVFVAKGYGIDEKEGFLMQIFNRWGEKYFETKDFNEGWLGTKSNSGNSNVVEDTYVYKIIYRDLDSKERVLYGHVSVIK